MATMFLLVVVLSFVASALAGTPCPDRQSIYPCSCLALPQGKKVFFTSVTCHRLHSTDSLTVIFPALRTMAIDHLYLYDSFWEANKLGTEEGENKQVLPTDWITLLKVKEIEIVDTTLSPCFACHSRVACRNSITTRFTAVNSSSHDKICTICKTDKGGDFTWTGCMTKLRQFHFQHGKLTIVRSDLFPTMMKELTEVDLSYNQITKIENNAFLMTPRLKVLNLSHNALQSLDAMFKGVKLLALEQLDVSWNLIKSLGANFFAGAPSLKGLKADNNDIVEMKESEWQGMGKDLRTIDLIDNPLHCDCNIRWINSTFSVNAVIQGVCATPEDYENSLLRKASRMLNERCTAEGSIGTRPNTKATTPSSH